ncbi:MULTISPECIES: hypothetical protein [Burkholderia]|uniref:hypothetical protein n=1 Tax=Burkholderia TaxID=32008 RepID=UPI000F5A4C94|nr:MULTISPECIES: hypothetical protein [Burkholderia]MBN3739651.1 hypothetical protein [Burkholderia sp. Tr-20355]RQS81802.1 hypothetical protein DF032_09585 [Burkholderia seminalis]
MPWNDERYPPSMRYLPPSVRRKAIEMANALLRQGRTEGSAIRIAIAQAKRWEDTRANLRGRSRGST